MSDTKPMVEDQGEVIALPLLIVRGGVAGVLMGLANLVPGISGGTMLLAAGVYPAFISAVGEFTTLRFRKASVVTLGSVVAAAAVAVVVLAGTVKDLVVDHRWIMYSLFIGLTLGGVPIVWRMIRRGAPSASENAGSPAAGVGPGVWLAAIAGLAAMAAMALAQSAGVGSASREGFAFMFLAGVAAASAMILPGVSGGYLLLVLGMYVPLLSAISEFSATLRSGEFEPMFAIVLRVLLPVALGVAAGVVMVSNVLRLLLARYEKATLGVLLGLLLGAVVGLWPFQTGKPPHVGEVLKGQVIVLNEDGTLIFADTRRVIEPADYELRRFTPGPMQVAGALGLVAAGFVVTHFVGRLGRDR